ncbi:hypothetical protein [Leptolyngbya sp. FACHB-261]|uniref:hypothetical protein n=1 Tax=Leptolyngbya sp. FACHB-261 TaxID=2692806 RepID=UPI0016857C7B|nr:hypothetical protein [Leptolyngbya sp. FACHB-261]MBD2103668.1 hypothetical protein [Leptolyngbya sp. FACHB-261]
MTKADRHLAYNLVPAGWVLGVLLVVIGLDFWTGLLAIGLGDILGCLQLALTASTSVDLTLDAVIRNIQTLTGSLDPLALLAVGLFSIVNNALNDNTAAYTLISAGIRVSRPVSALISAVLSFSMAVYGSGKFAILYENYLLVMLYWVAPWLGIVLIHWFLNGQRTPASYPAGWTRSATIFVLVAVLTISLFSSTPAYTGPVARLLDDTDIG